MSDIYFKRDKVGAEECKKYEKTYNQILEKRYQQLRWNPEDPKYSKYPKEAIDCHNNEIRRLLEEELLEEMV